MESNKRVSIIISVAIVWMFYLTSYIARVEPSILVNDLMQEFKITSSVVGLVISIMYIPYVILQIPCGIITDKLGVKTIVMVSSLLCALGTFVFGSANNIIELQLGRFLIGTASASAFICCGKIASDCFAKNKYAMLMGIAMCMGCLGGVAGTSPIAYLVSHIGWRNATFVITTCSIALAILTFIFLPNKSNQVVHSTKSNLLRGLQIMLHTPQTWLLGIYGAITYLPLSALAELWGVTFIEKRYGVPTETAAISSILIFIGFGIGGLISAYIAEKIHSYQKTIMFFTIALFFAFFTALYSNDISFYVCMILMFLIGLLAGANTLCFTIAFNLVPKQYAATSAGFMNTLIMSSGIIFQPLLGKLLDFFRNGMVTSSGEALYNVTMYRSTFLVIVFSMVIAIITTFFIRDVKHSEEHE